MKICEEMIKLRNHLDDNNIKWADDSTIPSAEQMCFLKKCGYENKYCDTTVFRTKFIVNDKYFSVVYGYGTRGGVDVCSDTDGGLLEMMVDNGEVEGWLTADNVIDYIRKELK